MTTKTTLLVDGDILAYRAAMLAEKSINWGEGMWTIHAYENEALDILQNQIATLAEAFPGSESVYALTDGVNFRTKVYPLYKSNRKEVRKPMLLPFIRQHMLDTYRTYLRPTLEGDDCLGILATSPTIIPGEKIVASIDKDLKVVPGVFYDFGKKVTHTISEGEALYWHYYQTLIGDTTDGYPGCPGIGPVAARRLLSTKPPVWATVVDEYVKAGLTEQDALVQARCAKILTVKEYNFREKSVILWTPDPTAHAVVPS